MLVVYYAVPLTDIFQAGTVISWCFVMKYYRNQTIDLGLGSTVVGPAGLGGAWPPHVLMIMMNSVLSINNLQT